jgi:hypothetical protein
MPLNINKFLKEFTSYIIASLNFFSRYNQAFLLLKSRDIIAI